VNTRNLHALRQQLRLYWVMDGSDLDSETGRARVTDALQSGVGCVQMRDKHSDTTILIERTRTLLRLARPWRVLVIVNDRVDVALTAGADGVHLGQSDTPLAQARAALGTHAVIGLSLEHPDQLASAVAAAAFSLTGGLADYLAISPVFDTPTKTNTAPAWGLEGLRQARLATRLPLVAIGGIDAARLPAVWATGVDGVAVVRAISDAADTGAAVTQLRSIMSDARPWRVPRVLSIAGSDSGGGAGIQADLKTLAALGCHGMSAVTALTAQNSMGVQAIHAAPPAFLAQQIASVLGDIGADALKIGMLHDEDTVDVVAQALQQHPLPTVLDPVMVATSGDALITPPTVRRLREQLFGACTVITPNLDELGLLVERRIDKLDDALRAAQTLLDQGARAVLVKGGHLQTPRLTDTLVDAGGVRWQRSAPRLISRNLHGTGCSLSSAIAAFLAQGLDLVDAVDAAHQWVRCALLAGLDLRLGAGHGPLNHFHSPLPLMPLEYPYA
jgi:hydroxymethylpyrimidine kinase/phosphomethylpyrimidine kinase/thiamine-phosphate diphosphorylase